VPLEGAAWIETIPFNETRDYVKKVLANAMYYTHALGKPAVTLTERVGKIAPKSLAEPNGGPVTTATRP
jgi:soluble lytic murein transglycosylase